MSQEPSPDKIQQLKQQYPDRSLHLVEAVDGDDVYQFVMTGPSRDEYRKFTDDVLAAKETKGSEGDKIAALRYAIERAAMAQIRWPEREEVKRVFDRKPAMIDGFAEKLHEAAGSNIELRSKNL